MTPTGVVDVRAASGDVPRWLRGAMFVLVAVVVVIGWGPRLRWGLLLDETFTAWQAQGGWTGIVPAKLANPGQSALFAYLEVAFYHPHSANMELWLRIPAVLGTAASYFFLYRLTETLLGKGTGGLAVTAFATNLSVLVYSTQARPYTLATAACLASLLGLARWLASGTRRDGLTFAISLALVIHLHLMFAVFLLVPALLIWSHARRGGRVDYRGLARWLALTALLLLPIVPQAARFARGSGGLSPFRLPGLHDLLETMVPGSLLLASVAFVMLLPVARRSGWRAVDDTTGRSMLALSLVWLIVPPIVFFAASRVVRQAVMIDRYFIHTIAAQALIVALAFRRFPPVLARVGLLACLLPFPIIFGLHERRAPDGPASWRRPVETVRALDPAAAAPVFVQAGHPLANGLDWQHGVEQGSFVFSQLAVYPLPNRVLPLPYAVDEAMKASVQRAADGELASAPVIFYAGIRPHPMTEWMRQFFAGRGYAPSFAVDEPQALLVLRK